MQNLTKHSEGSVRELWSLSFPLMLSSLSIMLLVFVDRILLARYSIAALNATVNSATLGWAFISGWTVLTGIAQVFVAQNNGAGLKERLGEPVWQMIWLSLGSCLFFMPLSIFGGDLIYGSGASMEKDYFQWMVFFGPSFAIYAALTGFFIGQGKTSLVTILALVTNFVNGGLDVLLIFGWEGVIPSLGVKGAAIATSSSGIFQTLVLGSFFLNSRNRSLHGTGNYAFNHQLFASCFRIGIPGAVFNMIEVLGWAAYYWLMTLVGEAYITVAGICQSLVILLYFFGDGVGKAISAITGNFIGSGRLSMVQIAMFSGFKLHLFSLIVMLLFFVWGVDHIIDQFLPYATLEQKEAIEGALRVSLFWITLFMFFEGLRLLLAGVLTAAGDTLFLLLGGSLSIWVFMIAPVYFIVVRGGASVEVSVQISVFYACSAFLLYLYRFYNGAWKRISIKAT